MRHKYESVNKVYEYDPKHIILDRKMCMIVQTRYFLISDPDIVQEIDVSKYDMRNNSHVIVREILFDKLYRPCLGFHPLALWFGIDDKYYVRECTYKERKQGNEETDQKLSHKKVTTTHHDNEDINIPTMPRCEQPFNIYYPKDETWHDLVSSILIHRLHTLTSTNKKNCTIQHHHDVLSEHELEQRFYSLQRHHLIFHWPINKGREIVDETTLIPKVDTKYEVSFTTNDNPYHFHQSKLWKSFIEASSNKFYIDGKCEEKKGNDQLEVFKTLSMGDSYTNCDGKR